MQKAAENMVNEADKMLSNSQETQKEAEVFVAKANETVQEVQTKFEKIKDEVVTLFNNGGKKDGVQVAKIENTEGLSHMEEFDSNGVLVSESFFVNNKLISIEEITQNKKTDI